jgi:hypothetical protein
MSIWLNAARVDIDGAARPRSFIDGDSANDVAAVRITSQFVSEDQVIIQGRPEDLLAMAHALVRTAELVVEQTMRDPELRRLYGLADPKLGQED